ncbi:DNA-3-methyladenine glycosylase I [Paucibacter sp. APW11]|uniref:DNA-3-methyladenine glycosylase I n=1 Tax=Roseateles aquae TaxID=3077235 RepID=A0ABU3PCD3_9BURK|nr:DNA-3-methyladenine glycosylase I [Paucibacter sp. APW11]MDT8999960.1 DNA-3-methyladenine glycosylase I [Paucibacter sp. APW11]
MAESQTPAAAAAQDLTLHTGDDGLARCRWCESPGFAEYRRYHDEEWGFPVADDIRLFEKICLEGFQSGLSWRTILAKRPAFRAAFAGFDFHRVARFGEADVERLLQDAGIVRHRGKIEAAIHNASRALELVAEQGSLAAYFWRYEDTAWTDPHWRAESALSQALSKDLRKRGWKFVGPTTVYAFMQAMGLVNDHAPGCALRERVRAARQAFTPPR